MIHPTAKVYVRTNRNLRARNTLIQLLAPYSDLKNHNAHAASQTDRRTDGQHDNANSRSYCVAVGSAKN